MSFRLGVAFAMRSITIMLRLAGGSGIEYKKQMVTRSNRKIAYALLQKFKDKYPEWFCEVKSPDGGFL